MVTQIAANEDLLPSRLFLRGPFLGGEVLSLGSVP